jgi:preprotein translocase subunit SecB
LKNNTTIQFVGFKVPESHIVFKKQGEYKINIAFNPRGSVFKSDSIFILKLGIQVKDEDDKFFIELESESTFNFSKDADLDKYLDGLFILNAPAIVFPYLRAYITNISAQSGMSPLILPTLNLSKLGKDLKENIDILD